MTSPQLFWRWPFLALAALLLILASPPAQAINITIGGVPITDLVGDPRDTDGAGNDTITFNSTLAGAAGFALPGYTVSGKVKLGGAGGVGAGKGSIITLTDFTATRIAAAGQVAPLVIAFSHTFPQPPKPAFAFDQIAGTATHTGAVNVQWQGNVNGVAIVKPVGPTVKNFGAPAGGANVDAVNGGHGLMNIPPPPGPPWTLRGDLTLSLGAVGDVFVMPNSAEVGVFAVPESSSACMVLAGLVAVGLAHRFKARRGL